MQKLNILHVGIFSPREPQKGLRRALQGVSNIYCEQDWQSYNGNINHWIDLQLSTGVFDVVFMQIQTPKIIDLKMLQKWHTKVKFYNFNGDLRQPMPQWYMDVAPYCTSLITNTDDVDQIWAAGHSAHYFQIGYDEEIYRPDGEAKDGGEIVFMGNNFQSHFQHSNLRKEMVHELTSRYKMRFRVYGTGWPNNIVHTNFKQLDEAAIYRGSKFAINLSHADAGRYTSDRMFRLMASGAFCLSYNYRGIEQEFKRGIDLFTWNNLEELFALIDYYTIHQEDRRSVAETGCKKVREKFGWKYRIENDFLKIHEIEKHG